MECNKIILSDNLEHIKTLPDNSVDAVLTDSPYGLGKEPDPVKCLQDWIDHGYHDIKGKGFMGKTWDAFVPQPILWKECYRVLKPGGYLLSFFGTRTYDWGTLAIRLAGFEIRDQILWVYGSGFPKSLDVSKAFDKAAGAERKVIGKQTGRAALPRPNIKGGNYISQNKERLTIDDITEPSTEEAKKWAGYGTALKPACEPICVARKPIEGTVIENVMKWGTGAINIDAGRVVTDEKISTNGGAKEVGVFGEYKGIQPYQTKGQEIGRWPANVIHDGSDEVLECFPDAPGQAAAVTGNEPSTAFSGDVKFSGMKNRVAFAEPRIDETTSAARFFYCAKASPSERSGRKHPTIKPLKLMQYLVKLFCPAGGVLLDPHLGSGTTIVACHGHCDCIGIDNDPASVKEGNEFIKKALGMFY